MRVGVERGPSWAATTPTVVVKEGYLTMPPNPGRTYDIAPDGQRFLMIKDGGADRNRRAGEPYRRAALGRGAEAPRADEVTGAVLPDHRPRGLLLRKSRSGE